LIVFTVGALSEETFFRGYTLQTLVRSDQVIAGVCITSFLFLVLHSGNPNVGFLPLFNTFLAGVWLAFAYLKTRDLWFPLGMHFMWNWLQGPVFGINVSGIADFSPDPVFRATDAGPAWLTGGNYGIEGGVACTFAILLSIGLVRLLPMAEPPAVTSG
jgi:membrane protease YdiL (CAAX protease family)